jgi:hypothetical protein
VNVLCFDIETIPDLAGGRRLYGLDGLSDADVARAMFQLRQQESGSDFLRHHLQRVVAISVALRSGDRFHLWSLGDVNSDEPDLIRRFFEGIDKHTPTLVSWNGGGFDLPVLHYRALIHGIPAPRYWENGDEVRDFRYNNYLNRFHERHTDLMDVLAAYQPRANAPLDEIAQLIGLPGKLGVGGDKVWDAFLEGRIKEIRDYCECDVLNTWLIYLRFELMRGRLAGQNYQAECQRVREWLAQEDKTHLREFLAAWREAG